MRLPRNSTVRLCQILLLLLIAPSAGHAQNALALSQVKKLYVDPLGQDKSADEIRNQLIRRLEKNHDVGVVPSREQADAVMKGTAQVWTTGHITQSPRTHVYTEATFEGFLSVEIVGKNDQVLWSYLVTPSKFPLGSIAEDLAAQLANHLSLVMKEKAQPEPAASNADANARAVLTGAGATFPAPLYQKWFELYEERHPDVKIHYEAVGSAEGIQRLTNGAVDFGASDMPLSDDAMSGAHQRFVHVPMVLGAVVPIYNVPHFSGEIRFTPEILAGIYLGKIKKWSDPQIRTANRGVSLPDADIVVVHRSDGSGTTFVWTDYLSKVSPEWHTSVGSGLTVRWPAGVAAPYNDGVASTVQKSPNSIGYVEFIYAIQHELSFASVRNAEGHYVRADIASMTAAVPHSASVHDLRISITNSPGNATYPIASYTWLLLPAEIKNKNKRDALLDVARWMLTYGQKSSAALGYAPLPADIVRRALESIDTVK